MILSPFPCVQAIVVATLAAVTLSACAAGVTVGTPESPPADLKARIASARPLAVENVCEPIRSVQGRHYQLLPNPDGKTYDVALMYYPDYGGPYTTIIFDLSVDPPKTKVLTLPTPLLQMGAATNGCLAPNGKWYRVAGGKKLDTGFLVYDPATNEVSRLEAEVDVGGETRPLVIGTDGMLYGAGSQDRAGIYQLNPDTGKVTSYGFVGPSYAPNACWGYSVGADDRYVYVASGKVPWYLIAYDRQTGKHEVIYTEKRPKASVHVFQQRYGCEARVQGDGTLYGTLYWLHGGKMIAKKDPKEAPPWTEPKERTPWVQLPPAPELSMHKVLPGGDGIAELWYRLPQDKATAVQSPPANADPKASGWKVVRFQVPTYTVGIHRAFTLADGRIFGAGGDYIGYYLYDPKTGQNEQLPPVAVNPYCIAQLDGKVYLSGYPSGALFEYDPAKPWTAGRQAPPWEAKKGPPTPDNPRLVTYLSGAGSGCHKMWVAMPASGKVFFGGHWARDGIGGGLGWYDPQTGKAGGISVPFRNYKIHYLALAGQYLVISTSAVYDQIGNIAEPDTAKLFIFDTQKMEIVREMEPIKGAKWTGPVAHAGGNYILGLTYNPAERVESRKPKDSKYPLSYGLADETSILYKLNIQTGEAVWQKTLPYPVGFCTNENAVNRDGFDFRLGPDGMIWTYTGGKNRPANPAKEWQYSYLGPDLCLVRISPEDGRVAVVGQLDQPGEIAFNGRDIYLSGGCKNLADRNTNLRRIRNLVPQSGADK